ncbi:hypothetical protein V4V36_13540 [Paenibacillus lautus]|uniref:hypothetical protein n=1 Tax=Paenibacillus lautus TaxID=1401 RepID=UPI002FBDC16A
MKIGYLPILDRYRLKDINFEYGCFIALDVCLPLYKVLEINAQSLQDTWGKIDDYVTNSLRIITDVYGEEIEIDAKDKLRDVDREIINEIEYRLKEPPRACYPLYFISVGDGIDERLVYVGKTSSKTHRFSGGHSAALKLHAPKYEGLSKHIYFGTVVFLDNNKNYMPLEFIQPFEDAKSLLSNLEAGLIFNLQPELNSIYLNNSYALFDMYVNIENHSSRPGLLQNKQVSIQT